jgi:hypothetical protein
MKPKPLLVFWLEKKMKMKLPITRKNPQKNAFNLRPFSSFPLLYTSLEKKNENLSCILEKFLSSSKKKNSYIFGVLTTLNRRK